MEVGAPIIAQLASNKFKNMLIFLYGSDKYRLHQKLIELIEDYKKKYQNKLGIFFFEENDFNFNNLLEILDSQSIFQEKKILILKNIFQNYDFEEKILEENKKFLKSQDVVLFYQEGIVKKSDKLFKFLFKNSQYQEFNELSGYDLKNWIKKEFKKYGVGVEPMIVEKLIEYCGSDLWSLSNEIKKLIAFKNEKISLKDVELMVKPKIETAIFKTIEAIALGNKKEAIYLIHKHLEKGDNPLYLLSMISFQFKSLLMSKSDKFWGKGKNPYFIMKTGKLAEKFSLEDLKKIYQKIFEMDINIKTGRVEAETALDLLIAEI